MKEWKLQGLSGTIAEALATRTKLPVETIHQLLEYGAVVRRARGTGSWQRVRRPEQALHATDQVTVTFDHRVLTIAPFTATQPLWEGKHYGVWFKPAGIMSQGTAAGDHASILYGVEKLGRTPFLVHRLDRETEGAMLIAYDGKAAGVLSQLFQQQKIQKTYHAIIVHADHLPETTRFTDTLDGKSAETEFRILQHLEHNRALAELKPITGRLHQIRRHLALNGSGVWGDPKYGQDNKNREGMKLAAVGIDFIDPWTKTPRSFKALASFSNA